MLTLEQLIKLGENINIDIFNGLTLPEDSPLDRLTLINTIIMKCGLNIPMYADPSVMASAINVWSAKNQYTFEHVGKIYLAEYSPIENKNYYTDRSRDLTDNTTGDSSKTDNTTSNTSGTTQKATAHTGTDTTRETDTTSAYNETTFSNKDQIATTLEHGENINESGNASTNSQTARTVGVESSSDKEVTENETVHEHGNIGVSTNFDLQAGEYRLLNDFRPYDFIAGLFENELTLYIY